MTWRSPAWWRLSPSRVSSGKNSHPCRRRNQVPAAEVRRAAISRVKASAPGPMSGSRPSLLGSAWWRLCLPFHQPRQSPAKTAERIRAVQSFHAPTRTSAGGRRRARGTRTGSPRLRARPRATAGTRSRPGRRRRPRSPRTPRCDGDPSPVPGVTSLEESAAPHLCRELGVRQGGWPRGRAPARAEGDRATVGTGSGRPAVTRSSSVRSAPVNDDRPYGGALPGRPRPRLSAGPPCERSRAAWPTHSGPDRGRDNLLRGGRWGDLDLRSRS